MMTPVVLPYQTSVCPVCGHPVVAITDSAIVAHLVAHVEASKAGQIACDVGRDDVH